MQSAAPLLAALTLATLAPVAHAVTPCDAPEQFVRVAVSDGRGAPQAAPLLRPYVIGGIAAIGMREEGGQRWLELAVHSAADARRQLSARAANAEGPEPVLATWRDRVWLRCPASLSAGL